MIQLKTIWMSKKTANCKHISLYQRKNGKKHSERDINWPKAHDGGSLIGRWKCAILTFHKLHLNTVTDLNDAGGSVEWWDESSKGDYTYSGHSFYNWELYMSGILPDSTTEKFHFFSLTALPVTAKTTVTASC